MTRCTPSTRPLPRRSLLAASLAAALAVAAPAAALTPQAKHDKIEAALPAHLDADQRAALRRQLQRTVRTPPPVPAGSPLVTNCNDSGAGSLRAAVADAAEGDTIDLTQLSCSFITLTSGEIVVAQDDLTLQGPGTVDLFLEVDAGGSQNLLHTGTGTLTVADMTVNSGVKYITEGSVVSPHGGCIQSLGSVTLQNAAVKYCMVDSRSDSSARGGAVFASSRIDVVDSVVGNNAVYSTDGIAFGGALYAYDAITLSSSTISGNFAASDVLSSIGGGVATPGDFGSKYSVLSDNAATSGGGASVRGNASVKYSTVHDNQAVIVAGLDLLGSTATDRLVIANSTIADNEASNSSFGAGLYVGNDANIRNSTISGNIERNGANAIQGAGLVIRANVEVLLEDTIVARNALRAGASYFPSDIGFASTSPPGTIVGSHNLVGASTITLPADTIASINPGLMPLADNGGPTPTMLPLADSLAVDAGNATTAWTHDQRGAGFPRLVGSAVDIGAVEIPPDLIFADGFD